jgi:hypothetical protein
MSEISSITRRLAMEEIPCQKGQVVYVNATAKHAQRMFAHQSATGWPHTGNLVFSLSSLSKIQSLEK